MTQKAAPPLAHLVVARAPGVEIRRRVRADADAEYRWRRDPELVRFDAATPTSDTLANFRRTVAYELAVGLPGRQAFALQTPDGEHIGTIMYYNADGDSAEIGISIAEARAQGRGLGPAAVVAFLRYLWDSRPFRRIVLHTLEWNERALRCFKRAGFEAVGRTRRNRDTFVRFEVRREYWLLRDMRGEFAFADLSPA
jgi:RimJ/RimL family protein N-acetyltransferase